MSQNTINQIFRHAYPEYDRTHLIPSHRREAAQRIMACRTAELGGHVQSCPDGHFQRVWYNSCKHRMCPQCAYLQVENWLNRQKTRILNCDHYHVIFTIPYELRFLMHMNYKLLAAILFTCTRDVIFQLTEEPGRIGARPGIIAGMHTWTRTLDKHPHIHCLVTGGGLSDRHTWQSLKGSYLFPFAVARDLFRGKVNAALKKALASERLILPDDMRKQQFVNLLNKLGRKKWNVKVCEKYDHGNGVLTYLARYLRGGPIGKKRIKQVSDTHVTINYGRKKTALMRLPIQEFIERCLDHAPPANTILVRSYGLYSHTKKAALNTARRALGQGDVKPPERLKWQDVIDRWNPDRTVCPVCRKALVIIRRVAPNHQGVRINDPPDDFRLKATA
jgi:hypothetical protein